MPWSNRDLVERLYRRPDTSPEPAYYFYRLKGDDFVSEFCVANASDPNQFVETLAPDGTVQRWAKREEGDLLVFHPPDGYDGNQGLFWAYDREIQLGEPMPRAMLEKYALRCRASAYFDAEGKM